MSRHKKCYPLSTGTCPQINNDLAWIRNYNKDEPELFHKVLPGAIEKLLDEKNQPLSKRADLGKYLGIRNIRGNFKEFSSHHDHPTGRDNQMQALEFANDEH